MISRSTGYRVSPFPPVVYQCYVCFSFIFHVCSDGKQESKENPAKRPATDINYDMPPPPSPASSTCSEQSGPILVSPGSATASKCRLRIGYVYEDPHPLFVAINSDKFHDILVKFSFS